jgi:hypothetical protein
MEHTDRLAEDLAQAHGAQLRSAGVAAPLSWSAIVAGAFAMAAFSLILLMLGTGLGLSSLSPWPGAGAHAKTFGFAAIIWVCVTQLMASGLGGYLAGRLRRHWPSISADETHFRDTAHGFLAWSLATLLTAISLTSVVSGVLREGVSAGAAAGASGVQMAEHSGAPDRGNATVAYRTWPMGYLIDGMLRPAANAPGAATQSPGGTSAAIEQKQEIARIFLNSLPNSDTLSSDDSNYVARIVAQQTGLAANDALARVTTTWQSLREKTSALETAARAEADKARKVTIYVTLWLFISLLIGAFSASLAATIGGRMREM